MRGIQGPGARQPFSCPLDVARAQRRAGEDGQAVRGPAVIKAVEPGERAVRLLQVGGGQRQQAAHVRVSARLFRQPVLQLERAGEGGELADEELEQCPRRLQAAFGLCERLGEAFASLLEVVLLLGLAPEGNELGGVGGAPWAARGFPAGGAALAPGLAGRGRREQAGAGRGGAARVEREADPRARVLVELVGHGVAGIAPLESPPQPDDSR